MHTRFLLPFLFLLACARPFRPEQAKIEEHTIRLLLEAQEGAWNRADIPAFMETYWHSDSLRFIGASGITYGWQATLDNYQKRYPTPEAMGRLKFSILSVEICSPTTAFVVGKWALQRKNDAPGGHFTLFWRKIGGQWVIVADHTS